MQKILPLPHMQKTHVSLNMHEMNYDMIEFNSVMAVSKQINFEF